MDLLCVFFILILILTVVSFNQKLMKNLLEMFLLCSIFKYGIFGVEESYKSAQKCIVTPDGGLFLGRGPFLVAFFGRRGALASVYARILLKSEYYNWRKDTTPRASCFFGQRESQILSPTTIKTGMAKICPFSMAYNYHVSSVCFRISCKLFYVHLRFLSSSCTRPRSKGWKNPETHSLKLSGRRNIKNAKSLLEMSFM